MSGDLGIVVKRVAGEITCPRDCDLIDPVAISRKRLTAISQIVEVSFEHLNRRFPGARLALVPIKFIEQSNNRRICIQHVSGKLTRGGNGDFVRRPCASPRQRLAVDAKIL